MFQDDDEFVRYLTDYLCDTLNFDFSRDEMYMRIKEFMDNLP